MKKVLVIVSYSLAENKKEDDFLIISDKIEKELMPQLKGFINRKILKNDDGRFCDMTEWDFMENAQKAIKEVRKNKICLPMFSFINIYSIKIEYWNMVR